MEGTFNFSALDDLDFELGTTIPSSIDIIKVDGQALPVVNKTVNIDLATPLSRKQDKLVSRVNIKTINGDSILGSGNLVISGGEGGLTSVKHDNTLTGSGTNESPLGVNSTKYQSKLVSGTNIKTINGKTVLGSGDLELDADDIMSENDLSVQDNIDAIYDDLDDKQNKLTSENAGENVTITEVGGIVKINSTGGGEGSGLVDDVKVDGVSVVTDKVANIELKPIKDLIPYQASTTNQLSDKNYVNSSISTATAEFKGTFTTLSELQATDGNMNDYAFYSHTDEQGNKVFDRYKYVGLPDKRVPDGYTQYKSISNNVSTNGRYINTGIVIKSDYSIEAKVKLTQNYLGNYDCRVAGVQDNENNQLLIYKTNGQLNYSIYYGKGTIASPRVTTNGNYDTVILNSTFGKINDDIIQFQMPNINDGYPLYLFKPNYKGTPTTNERDVWIEEFKIKNGSGEYIFDGVPCRNNIGQIGLYDAVTGLFFGDVNGGDFGFETLSGDRWLYEYSLNNSSFTAEQWATINSGVTSQIITDVSNINTKIPTQASISNQLADKNFVNSSISTSTAEFRGTFTDLSKLKAAQGNLNDYSYLKVVDSVTGLVKQYDRYKYVPSEEIQLPDGYSFCGYVSIINNAYFNTNYTPKANTTIEITTKSNLTSGAYHTYCLMGNDHERLEWSNANQWGIHKLGDQQYCGNGANVNTHFYMDTQEHVLRLTPNGIFLDDERKGSGSAVASTSPIYVGTFTINGVPKTDWNLQDTVGIYRIKISESDKETPVMDLVACEDNGNHFIGFYDLVGERFYTSEGDNQFNSFARPSDNWKYEYTLNNSSFTSEQWNTINSEIVKNVTSNGFDNTKVQVLKNINGTLTWVDE